MKNIIYQPLAGFITDLEAGGRPRGGGKTSGDIVSLGAEHLSDSGGFNFKNLKYIPKDYFEGMNKGIIQKDDILIVKDGATTGKVAIVREDFPYKAAAVNEHLFILRIKKDKLEPKFLFYFLFSGVGQSLIMKGFHGSAQGGITKSFIDNILVPVLDLPIQRKIASILEKAESAKQKRQETLRLTDEFLKSAFLQMFGNPIADSKRWERGELGKVLDVRDGTHDTPKYIPRGIPLITSKNLKDGEIDFDNVFYISQDDYEQIIKRSFVENGDILYGMIGTIGSPVIVQTDRKFGIKNVALFKFKDKKVNNYYIKTLFDDEFLTRKLLSEKRGGNQKFVSLDILRNFSIPLPPFELQQKFANLAQKVEALKAKQLASAQELDNLFNSLMQKAFKGELC